MAREGIKDIGLNNPDAGDPGATLKALRTRRGWTLADVRDLTGLSVSTLSKIENGKMGLSYDKLLKLGSGLNLDISQLLSGEQAQKGSFIPLIAGGRRAITRKENTSSVTTAAYGYAYHASELLAKSMDPMLMDINARSIDDIEEFSRHAGEEFVLVVKGAIEFHCEFYKATRLDEGDSIYFDAAMAHAFVAVAPGECRILSVCTGNKEIR